MDIPKDARVIILEGIPGSGKTTLQKELKEKLKDKTIYDFDEEELLYTWKHAWIPRIEKVRLEFMDRLLDYIKEILSSDKNAVFILNRFHISFDILAVNKDSETKKGYEALVKKVKGMKGVHILISTLDEHQIKERCSHKERKEKIWQLHLKKRMETRGFSDLKDMYIWEQNRILELAKQQGIPYSAVKVD